MTTSEFHANPDNFCYRHPGRQSFVLCQRCMRTICPECQTQAPVGVICPECMQEQRSNQSPAQRKAQRRSLSLSKGGSRTMTAVGGRPLVTYSIIGITSAVSLLQMLPGIGGVITKALEFCGRISLPPSVRAAVRTLAIADRDARPRRFHPPRPQHARTVDDRAEPGAADRPGEVPRPSTW